MEELLKEVLVELKKINEYIDIQKAKTVININNSSTSKQNQKETSTYQEVLTTFRQYLQE
ncbi:hypothetical protein Q428_08885 [Fervidicella metallireducens AeB]|uniref:Uncharacterized protein n=1 Tax=Fervidicella metallireducens AeB TaxID=1403537 RepID=A0A017RUK2_9CLOT|nr:hypothetical protein Q428_08885 [Fervidicella metallireducens AeB]